MLHFKGNMSNMVQYHVETGKQEMTRIAILLHGKDWSNASAVLDLYLTDARTYAQRLSSFVHFDSTSSALAIYDPFVPKTNTQTNRSTQQAMNLASRHFDVATEIGSLYR